MRDESNERSRGPVGIREGRFFRGPICQTQDLAKKSSDGQSSRLDLCTQHSHSWTMISFYYLLVKLADLPKTHLLATAARR